MNIHRFITGCAVAAACTASAHAAGDDGGTEDSGRGLHGELYTEVNYGYRFGDDDRNRWDFPHVVLSAELGLGRGWTIAAELEYERMREDGRWCNDHWDNFATNRLYIEKQWRDELAMKIGVVDVPLGVTNSGGPALTIYDPLSEAAIMPMTWHEGGVALHGTLGGRADYMVAALAYGDLPLSGCRAVGVAAAAGYAPAEGLRVGVGGFSGRTAKGMLKYCAPDFVSESSITYGVADVCYENGGWVASGSLVYCTDSDARSVGLEAGYDVLTSEAGNCGWGLTPFVRYDGVFSLPEENIRKFTVGLNVGLPENFIIKAEYGHCNHSGSGVARTLDVCAGYTFRF